jgi:hypothetical protein
MVISASPTFEEELTASELCSGTKYTEYFTSADIPAGTTLYFSVVAYNAIGLGEPSNIVSKTVPGGSVTYSLDGYWKADDGGIVLINGSSGVFVKMFPNALWDDAVNKGWAKVGDQWLRNLTKTGDLTWRAQELLVHHYTTTPNVAIKVDFEDITITMSADGQSWTSSFSGGGNHWTRFTPNTSLDGIWICEGYCKVTINGNSGILNIFYNPDALGQSSLDQGFVTYNSTQWWRNLTKSGNSTWSGQQLTVSYRTSNPNVCTGVGYGQNVTLTMSADGQTLTATSPSWGSGSATYTRQ